MMTSDASAWLCSKRAYEQYVALVEAKFAAMPIGAEEDRRALGAE